MASPLSVHPLSLAFQRLTACIMQPWRALCVRLAPWQVARVALFILLSYPVSHGRWTRTAIRLFWRRRAAADGRLRLGPMRLRNLHLRNHMPISEWYLAHSRHVLYFVRVCRCSLRLSCRRREASRLADR